MHHPFHTPVTQLNLLTLPLTCQAMKELQGVEFIKKSTMETCKLLTHYLLLGSKGLRGNGLVSALHLVLGTVVCGRDLQQTLYGPHT